MEKNIYIAGAHSRGQTFKEYISLLCPDTSVAAYLVDDLSENKSEIGGVSVIEIGKEAQLHTDYPVYIATRSVFHKKITAELSALGMRYIYPVDVSLDTRLRNAYVQRVFEENHKEFCKMDACMPQRSVHARIYVAHSVYDKELEDVYRLSPEERTIQVGTALTDQRLEHASAFDNTGENISVKNKQYCELTALYWIWKNAQQDVVGLVHYRRHFLLPDNWLDRMNYNGIDVILPVPLYVGPSLAENYMERHDPSDWIYMMEYLQKNCPDDYKAAQEFFRGNLYSPCNMFIMRKNVLDKLCEWLFPILAAGEAHGGEKDDPYLNRYPGFLSERLITYFFERHRDKYKVVYANKNFLS